MLDFPEINLTDFCVSAQNGFLPTEQPLQRLSDPYYRPWEDIMSDLPDLITTGEIRQKVLNLPILSTNRLYDEAEWERSYLVLAFLTHAYIWGGKEPEDVCDPPDEHHFRHVPTDQSIHRDCHHPYPALFCKFHRISNCHPARHMRPSTCGTLLLSPIKPKTSPIRTI